MHAHTARPLPGAIAVVLLLILYRVRSQGLPRDVASVVSASSAAQTLSRALQRAEQWRQEVHMGLVI